MPCSPTCHTGPCKDYSLAVRADSLVCVLSSARWCKTGVNGELYIGVTGSIGAPQRSVGGQGGGNSDFLAGEVKIGEPPCFRRLNQPAAIRLFQTGIYCWMAGCARLSSGTAKSTYDCGRQVRSECRSAAFRQAMPEFAQRRDGRVGARHLPERVIVECEACRCREWATASLCWPARQRSGQP